MDVRNYLLSMCVRLTHLWVIEMLLLVDWREETKGTSHIVVQLCPALRNPWTIACQASLSFTISWNLLKLSGAIQPSHPLLPPSSPAMQVISIKVFSSGFALCIRWSKYWNFSFSTSLSNKYSGLVSFRIDWFDCLAVQGTLKSLLQHYNSKASILGTQPSL